MLFAHPLAWALSFLSSLRTQDRSPSHLITTKVQQFAQDLLVNGSLPGMTLAVVHPDGTVETAGFGIKTELGQSMTADTLFGIASCSKAFLASSFGILIDDFANGRNATPLPDGVSRLDWRTKVKDVLPDDWKLMDDFTTDMADFRDILSHQSGFPRHEFSYQPTDTLLDVIRRQRLLRPAFELRQRYHYINQMYMVASHVISVYSGMPYMEFVKKRIWEPLNMTSTTFSENEASGDGLLTQSWTASGRRIPFWFPDRTAHLMAGPAAIISNVHDLSKWVRALLNGGVDPLTNITIVPATTLSEQRSTQIVMDLAPAFPDASLAGYTYGWVRESFQGHEVLSHPGAVPGFSDEILLLPSQKLGIIALGNADSKQPQELAVSYRIIEDYLDLPRSASIQFASLPSAGDIPIPDPVAGSIPLEEYAGRYSSPGYPTLMLCDPHHPEAQCEDILKVYSALEDVTATTSTLYFELPSVWVSHGRLRREEENNFQFTATYLFPQGYGQNATAFETDVSPLTLATAKFAVDEGKVTGFGLFGLVGEKTERQRNGGTLEETAEVWFEKTPW